MPLNTKSLVPTESFVPESGTPFIAGETRVDAGSPDAKKYAHLLTEAPEEGSKAKGDMLVASESFVGTLPSGADFVGRKDVTRVRSGDPAAKAWPDLFKPLDVSYPEVETATAGPGEKRGT